MCYNSFSTLGHRMTFLTNDFSYVDSFLIRHKEGHSSCMYSMFVVLSLLELMPFFHCVLSNAGELCLSFPLVPRLLY